MSLAEKNNSTQEIETAPGLPRNDSMDMDKKEDIIEDPIVSQENTLNLWQAFKVYPKASMYSALGAMSAISDGYQYNLPGNILALPGFIQQFGYFNQSQNKYVLDAQQVGIWGALYTVAYIISLYSSGYPSDRWGRKPMILMIQVFCVFSCLTEMFATHWTHWLAAKILNGISVGINQSAIMTYVSEIAPTPARGALLGNYPIWWTVGSFTANITLNIMSKKAAEQWRHAVYSQWAFTGTAIIIWFFLPESPRWLCRKGRHEDARNLLRKINGGVKGYDLEREYAIIQHEVEDGIALSNQQKNVNIFSVFRGTNLRRTFISFMPFAWQQWTGNPVISQYTAYFFQLAGMKDPFVGSLCVSIIKLVSAIISPIFTELAGRRRLILIGGAILVPCMYSLAGVLRVPDLANNGPAGVGLIVISCVWMASYASTLNTIGYVYLGETSTLLLRAMTTGVAAGSTGFLNIFINYCTPVMLNAPGFGPSGTCFLYGSTCLFGLVIAYFFIPETKGRSYIELDELFERRIPARQFKETVTKVDIAKKEAAERGQV